MKAEIQIDRQNFWIQGPRTLKVTRRGALGVAEHRITAKKNSANIEIPQKNSENVEIPHTNSANIAIL